MFQLKAAFPSGNQSKRRPVMAVFSDAFLRLRQDFDRSHENRQKLIQDVRDNVRDMARQTADQLTEQGNSRRAEFTATMTDVRGKIKEQAEQTRGQLAEQGKSRRAEFTAMMTDVRGKITEQAEQTRGQLANLAADLRQGGAVFSRRQPARKHGTRSR
jgi:phage host-nuclease inhibitor protein Gam